MTPQRGRSAASRLHPSSARTRRLIRGILILGAGMLGVLIGVGLFLTHRITTTYNNIENVTPASYLLANYENLNFRDAQGGEHKGWLLLGLRGAPVVVLCPGYNSNRSELLSLGTTLQANHFNVYLFNFESSGSKERFSNLGIREAATLKAAITRVTRFPGVNSRRVGLYGDTLGGYAALVVSEQHPIVKALVVDDAYERPAQMFDYQVNRLLGGAGWLFRLLATAEFHLFTLRSKVPNVRAGLSSLEGRPKLFLAAEDAPALKRITQDLYGQAPEPKRLLILARTQETLVSGPERKEYENQVLNFFLQNLALRAD